jgi:hypothetical protein
MSFCTKYIFFLLLRRITVLINARGVCVFSLRFYITSVKIIKCMLIEAVKLGHIKPISTEVITMMSTFCILIVHQVYFQSLAHVRMILFRTLTFLQVLLKTNEAHATNIALQSILPSYVCLEKNGSLVIISFRSFK